MNKVKILVTGATGNVGRPLVSFLDKKYHNITSLTTENVKDNQVLGNLNDFPSLINATKNIEIVIHLASLIKGNKKQLKKINIEGTKNLIVACKKNNVKKIIYISSLDIKFNTSYGISKKRAEDLIENSGLDYIILRPSLIYGEEFDKGIIELINFIKKHSIIPIPGNGENLFSPLYINDLISIINQIIEKNKFNKEKYFICGKQAINMNQLINLISSNLNKKIIKIHVPIKFAGKILNIFGIHIGIIENAYLNKTDNNDKIKKDFDFRPMGIGEGIKKVFDKK